MAARLRLSIALLLSMSIGACSSKQPSHSPTEEQIHANDRSLAAHHVGTHRFRCRDGTVLLVDFAKKGMSIEIRTAETSPPLVLTAPTQGAAYVGDHASATLEERELHLTEPDRSRRDCIRESLG